MQARTVTIENHDGRLRLRWAYQGKRYTLAVGVPDNPTGRAIANQKKAQIELDIQAGYFDETLLKYKPRTIGKTAVEISTVELFAKFTEQQAKLKLLSPRSVETRYIPLQKCLAKYLNVPAAKVTAGLAEKFMKQLLELNTPQTVKARLWLLRSCWEWARGKYAIAESNPWQGLASRVKVEASNKQKPFSRAEIQLILTAFRKNVYYRHYYPLVAFLFGTGCRFGEVVALRWQNVAEDFSHVFICETISRGHHRSTTKNGKARRVVLNSSVSALLSELSQKPHHPHDLVFPSPRGKVIDDHCFNRRAWHTILGELGIEYRKPYCTRHSAISHALTSVAIAETISRKVGKPPKTN